MWMSRPFGDCGNGMTEERAGDTEIQSFSLPRVLVQRLRDYCEEQGAKKSPVVASAVEAFLNKEKNRR